MDSHPPLRPLTLEGIVGAAFGVYVGNYLTFVCTMAVGQIPLAALSVALQLTPDLVVLWLPLMLVVVALALISIAGTIFAADRSYLGETVGPDTALLAAFRRLLSLAGAACVVGIVVGLLAITVVGIPFAIYFAVRWSMVPCAIMLEGQSARQSLSRSTALVRGSWWRVFGIGVALSLMLGVSSLILGAVFGAAVRVATEELGSDAYVITTALVTALLASLIGAFTVIGQTILFHDLRLPK